MIAEAKTKYELIQQDIHRLPLNEFLLSPDEENNLRSQKIDTLVESHLQSMSEVSRTRLCHELNSLGPLEELMADESITEILVNGPESIWFEKDGRLYRHKDSFYSELSFRNCLDRLCHAAGVHITHEYPCVDGSVEGFRLSLIGSELTRTATHLSLRRHPKNSWTFEKLLARQWCSEKEVEFFKSLMMKKENFLVIGPTGCGKTSVLNSFLALLDDNERVVVLEDTAEIALSNKASMKLLTREDPQGILPPIDQTQLVKRALRLRPDRIVMGEIRGSEAKDFLMALSTGHGGSFGTLHAQSAAQALIRLEMLIQMGAPQWSLMAIRKLIQLSLNYVIVTGKNLDGSRCFQGAYQLSSLEEHGFLLEPVDFF